MDPLRPGYRHRETRKQDQTQLVIATIIAVPVVMIVFLSAISRTGTDRDSPSVTPVPSPVSVVTPSTVPTPAPVRRVVQPPPVVRQTRDVEFYSHPAPVPTLTAKQRYERASEIYRSMGSGSSSAPRPAAPRQAQTQPDYSAVCARLAKEKARIESHMRTGYNASSSRYYHDRLNGVVQRMQRYHCLR